MTPVNLTREDVEAVQRLRQLYPPHILASLFDDANSSLLSPARESVSSFSSSSARSSVSSSPKNHNRNTGASYTSSIPAIDERAVSPHPFSPRSSKAPSIVSPTSVSGRPRGLSRSVSDYAIREHALNVRSFPQKVNAATPVYFCVHCGNGFEKRADWETHEWIFHERQSYWPCPQPGCQAFFDSGKAFEAHHQAVHGCGRCDHAEQTVQLLPERKAWACGFTGCKEVFLDWSKRCKHVSAHYESLARKQGNFRESPEWTYSTTIRNLLRQPDLKDPFKKFMTKIHGHSKSSWPQLEWQPDKCAELQRCLEFRDFQRGIPDIVHLSYRLGHPVYAVAGQPSRPPSPPEHALSPQALSPRSSSLRSRTRSRSIMSGMSGTTVMSPSSPPRNSRKQPYPYDRALSDSARLVGSHRVSETPSNVSGLSAPSPPRTRGISPMRAPSVLTVNTEIRRPSTATNKKRMVAREPEVRGTTSHALLDFLAQGPPTAPEKGEHRAKRVPSARSSTPYDAEFGDELQTPAVETPAIDTPATEPDAFFTPMSAKYTSPRVPKAFDFPAAPPKDDNHLPFRPDRPVSDIIEANEENHASESEEQPQQQEEDRIQETILTLKAPPTFQASRFGQKILPPTPGPPPSQSLPIPPPPALSPPQIVFPDTLPDTPTTECGDVPPSPMPPGFTDISNWPAPPPLFSDSASPTSTSTVVEAPPSPLHFHPPAPVTQEIEIQERPRTAHSRLAGPPKSAPEPIRLMAPPKRARSASRGRTRSLRWMSLNPSVDPPMPSPGVDFGSMLSQPLDTASPASPPFAMTAAAVN